MVDRQGQWSWVVVRRKRVGRSASIISGARRRFGRANRRHLDQR
jgi:hypothetical protein